MNEELKEKLKLVLQGNGIDEETALKVLAELDTQEEEPKAEEEGQSAPEEQAVTDEAVAMEEPKGEEPNEVTPEETTPAPIPETQPVEETTPQPQVDFADYDNKIEEQNKTIEALLARVESLEEALKGAGVLEGQVSPVGYHKPEARDKEPIGDGLDDFFSRVNRKKF